ncbi:hypothetical protein D7D52_25540 [Nocardia yunnanensis]|uniref:Uncharacterized protein n=1 Tax=Nocardia yunnanensis TaxID=2382165 RepID=A0A386ZHF7_9NOCA|nr:hypothetical protein D7D52_25540 [Nocardia yunnanensis]
MRRGSDCPGCGGDEIDPRRALDAALDVAAGFPDDVDPFRVEFLIAELLAPGPAEDFGLRELFGAAAVLRFETRATAPALGLLRGITRLTTGELSRAAGAAADRLEVGGTTVPRWYRQLLAPVRPREFTRSAAGHQAVLMASFDRGGDIHAFAACVDLRAGVASDITLLAGGEAGVRRQLAGVGLPGVTQRLPLADFRAELESALDRRARADRTDHHLRPFTADELQRDTTPYVLAAAVLRAHLRAVDSAPDRGE